MTFDGVLAMQHYCDLTLFRRLTHDVSAVIAMATASGRMAIESDDTCTVCLLLGCEQMGITVHGIWETDKRMAGILVGKRAVGLPCILHRSCDMGKAI